MKTVTINVLAKDFIGNFYCCIDCPVIRALTRSGIDFPNAYRLLAVQQADSRAQGMFDGQESIQNFSFDININE